MCESYFKLKLFSTATLCFSQVLRSDNGSYSTALNYDGVKKIDSVPLSELNSIDRSSPLKVRLHLNTLMLY